MKELGQGDLIESRSEVKWGGLTSKKHPLAAHTPACPSVGAQVGTREAPEPQLEAGTPGAGSKPVVACCLHCRLLSFAGWAYLKIRLKSFLL
jgi:hypothetical protein